MDLSSLKVVGSESISILYGLLPGLFGMIWCIMALGDNKGSLLDKYREDLDDFTLKLATAMAIATLIVVPYCSKHLIQHDVKITNEVEFNNTKYTKGVRKSILERSGDNRLSSSDGYLSIDKDGKVYYNQKISQKEFNEIKKDDVLEKHLKEGYKEVLKWHIKDAIKNSNQDNENKVNELNSKYDNLTDEEKEKAMELYQRLKDEDANKTSASSDYSYNLIYQSLFDD